MFRQARDDLIHASKTNDDVAFPSDLESGEPASPARKSRVVAIVTVERGGRRWYTSALIHLLAKP